MASPSLADDAKAKREALLEEKMKKIREKNAAILKRNAEIEADKKRYEESVAKEQSRTKPSPETPTNKTERHEGTHALPNKAPSGVRTEGVIQKMGGRGQRLAKMSQEKLKAKEWEDKRRNACQTHQYQYENEKSQYGSEQSQEEKPVKAMASNNILHNKRPQHAHQKADQKPHQPAQSRAEIQKAKEFQEKKKKNIAAVEEEMKQEGARPRGLLDDYDKRQDMSRTTDRNARSYGAGNQRGFQRMTGREKAEYKNWKMEREEVEQQRLSHQKQGDSWKREWDQKKVWDKRRQMWVYASAMDDQDRRAYEKEEKKVKVSDKTVENLGGNEVWDIEVTLSNTVEEPKPQRTHKDRTKRNRGNMRERDTKSPRKNENETKVETYEHVNTRREEVWDNKNEVIVSDDKRSEKHDQLKEAKMEVEEVEVTQETATKESRRGNSEVAGDVKHEGNQILHHKEQAHQSEVKKRAESETDKKIPVLRNDKDLETTEVKVDKRAKEGDVVEEEEVDDEDEWEDDGEWETEDEEEEVNEESESDTDEKDFHDCDGGGSVINVTEQQAAKVDLLKHSVPEVKTAEVQSTIDALKSPTFDELFGSEPTTHIDWGDCEVDEEKLIKECQIFKY